MQKRTYYIIISSIILIGVGIYVYSFLTKEDPLEVFIPVGDVLKVPEYSYSIYGNEEYLMQQPLDVIVHQNEVYVSDSDAGRVLVFDRNGEMKRVIGEKDQRLNHPYGLAVYEGNLYVADGGLAKIAIFSLDGTFKNYWTPKDSRKLSVPAGLVVTNDEIILTDLGKDGVYVFDHSGKFIRAFGGIGIEPGMFDKPHGIVIDEKENYVVTDSNNARVQVFDKEGKFLEIIALNEGNKGEILSPRGITVGDQGYIYVASGMENRIYVFDKDYKFLFFISDIDKETTLSLPNGVAIDGHKLYVTEFGTKRVSVFSY